MKYDIDTIVRFGQYQGLTVQQIYQGTLNINKNLISSYLSKILNEWKIGDVPLSRDELIEEFMVSETEIKVIGQVFNEELPPDETNRVLFSNLTSIIEPYINNPFRNNNLGILTNIRNFNRLQPNKFCLGADPEYLEYCIRKFDDFLLSEKCIEELTTLPISRFIGFYLLYKKNNSYEYHPKISLETYKFHL